MATINSRSKGQRGEREIVKLLQSVVDKVCEEHSVEKVLIERNQNQSNQGGYDLIGLDWLAPEVKRCETLSVDKWWEQTLRQAKPGQMPVLFYRKSRMSWKVRVWGSAECAVGAKIAVEIEIEDFLKIFEKVCKDRMQKCL